MYKLMQKHRRRFLAIATAFLMVAFLIPTFRNPGGGDEVIGTIKGDKIYLSQKKRADHEWDLLRNQIYFFQGSNTANGLQPLAAGLGNYAVDQIDQHHELFLLLQVEAHKQGVFISDERVQNLFDQVATPRIDTTKIENQEAVKGALHSYLLVMEAYDRAAAAVRVSQPLRDYEIATRLQQVKLSTVEFAAADYLANVPEPTAQQITEQFEKYKNEDPLKIDPLSTANPFGFGYRFPDRVVLQYLKLPSDQVRKAVEGSRKPNEWKVDAWKYYMTHPGEFTGTTQPKTDNSGLTLGTTKPAATTATTRPFEEVEKEVMEALIQPAVEKKQAAILARINSILVGDWATFQGAKEGQAPVSSLGVAYNSYEYLQKIAEVVQREFQVTLTIEQWAKPYSATDIQMLGGIAYSMTPSTRMPFAIYATMTEDMYKTISRRNPAIPKALALWQPSQVVRDFFADSYIFRVTQRSPAHTPKDTSENGLAAKVAADCKGIKAFELAKTAAYLFYNNAKAQGLTVAATAAKKTVVPTGLFDRENTSTLGIPLSKENSAYVFASTAIKSVLRQLASGEKNPLAIIPVYQDGKVFVIRLEQVKESWTAQKLPQEQVLTDRQVASNFSLPLQLEWFSFPKVSQRLQYQPRENRKGPQEPTEEQAPTPGLTL